MISTRAVLNLRDVPEEFVYEYFLKLPEPLQGDEVWITSIFNPSEKKPSMSLFYEKNRRYHWHDFSSGFGGSSFDLVQKLFPEETKGQIAQRIINTYKSEISGNPPEAREHRIFTKYKVSSFQLRSWNTLDKKYWNRYGIGSKSLEHFNIAPLESFKMTKEVDGVPDTILISRRLIYGFFRKTGDLYKIYQPENIDCKFIKVQNDYLQGYDQLSFNKPNLLITKALKDVVQFHVLDIPNWDVLSPDSENQLISKRQMETLSNYTNKRVLFDNDAAGEQGSLKYKEAYGIEPLYLKIEKDLSDSCAKVGVEKVRNELLKLL